MRAQHEHIKNITTHPALTGQGGYFLGNAIRPEHFPHFDKPQQITLSSAGKSYSVAFPHTAITKHLLELSKRSEYKDINTLRNTLAHRISGRRSIQFLGATHPDGTDRETRKEYLHVPGLGKPVNLSDALLQQHLDHIRNLLTTLASASRQFAESRGAA
jgi:hypothetical protein